MAELDPVFTEERLKADSAELQRRLMGRTFHEETVQLEAAKPSRVAPEDVGFIQPENIRTDAEIAAMQAPTTTAPAAPAKTPFGFHEPGLVAGEAVGAAAGGALDVLSDPRNAWMGLGPLAMFKWSSGAKGLLRPRFDVEETIQRALRPSPLAERVTEVINSKTAVLTDADAAAQAEALVQSGGVRKSVV